MDRRKVLKRLAALGLAVPATSVERAYFFGPWALDHWPKLSGDATHNDAAALQCLDRARQISKGLHDRLVKSFWSISMGGRRLVCGSIAGDVLNTYSSSAEFWEIWELELAAEAMGHKRMDIEFADFDKQMRRGGSAN